jgi:acyl-CoA synthetase (AMP-forming)/AMP-acid ligase II
MARAQPAMRAVFALPGRDGSDATLPALAYPAEAAGELAPPSADPDQVVYLAFTSGTTGEPKGVMHSDNTLLANARALSADWKLFEKAVIYSMSPLSHNLGFGAMVMSLARGSELVVHDLARGKSLVDRLTETGATFVIGVPTHAIDLLAELRTRGLNKLGNVSGFRISGASVAPSVCAELLKFGVVPQSGYGMTEACSHHYTRMDDDPRLIIETSGKACDGYEIRIFDRDNPDRELPAGEVGQIGGRGASLMLGYFDDQASTEASFNTAGWFMTGDLGWMDENGYLRITGRKKDVIIRGGHNIFPARIEALAMRHGAVVLCETRAICGYIDAMFPGPKLIPTEPVAAAYCEQWMSLVTTHIDSILLRQYLIGYFFPGTADGSPDRVKIDAALPKLPGVFAMLENELMAHHYLGGDTFTLADIMLFPLVTFLPRGPESAELLKAAPHLQAWFDRINARPSAVATVPPPMPKR